MGRIRFINDRVHGAIDYLVVLALVIVPQLVGFEGAAFLVPVVLGLGLFIYSVLTSYFLSLVKLIPFWLHLVFDFFAALVLIFAPGFFEFGGGAQVFLLIVGLAVILVVVFTDPRTTY